MGGSSPHPARPGLLGQVHADRGLFEALQVDAAGPHELPDCHAPRVGPLGGSEHTDCPLETGDAGARSGLDLPGGDPAGEVIAFGRGRDLNGGTADRETVLEIGIGLFDSVLLKPFLMEDLQSAIQIALASRERKHGGIGGGV